MAQVIPVLILAIVFEMRALEQGAPIRRRFYTALLIYVLAIGEALAVAGTYFGTDPVGARAWISFSAMGGGVYLIGNIAGPSFDEMQALPKRRSVRVGLSIVFTFLWAVLPYYLVRKFFDF